MTLLLLSGCDGSKLEELRAAQEAANRRREVVHFENMEYTRPDMDALKDSLEDALDAAEKDDLDKISDSITAFYEVYDAFYTSYTLADIHYCIDMTDTSWEEEYQFCLENSPEVDAALEKLYYALAKSPCLEELESDEYFGEGYFDSYQGENKWDEEFVALLEQESHLQGRYYDLTYQ
jgi:hypothetical protein